MKFRRWSSNSFRCSKKCFDLGHEVLIQPPTVGLIVAGGAEQATGSIGQAQDFVDPGQVALARAGTLYEILESRHQGGYPVGAEHLSEDDITLLFVASDLSVRHRTHLPSNPVIAAMRQPGSSEQPQPSCSRSLLWRLDGRRT